MFKGATMKPVKILKAAPRAVISHVIFGLPQPERFSAVVGALERRGLSVAFADDAEGAYHEAAAIPGAVVVIPVKPQAGLLATAKIITSLPNARIVLLAPQDDERVRQFAEFLDANIAFETGTGQELLAAILSWN